MKLPVLVVTGVNREAACLRGLPGLVVVTGGDDADGLRRTLESADATGIVSFGMAGALLGDLRLGQWVIGDRLVGAVPAVCDVAWRMSLVAALPAARTGTFYADGRMIATVAEKASLAARSDAVAVDMESHIAAAVAQARALPFAIVRCISDPAMRSLPPAITVAMRADGGVDTRAVVRSLASFPAQLPDFVRTLAGFARAMRALRQGAVRLGPALSRRL